MVSIRQKRSEKEMVVIRWQDHRMLTDACGQRRLAPVVQANRWALEFRLWRISDRIGSVRGEEENWGRVAPYLLLVACMHLHLDSFAIDWGHTFSFPLSCIFTLLHSALPISPALSQQQWRGVGAMYYSTQLLLWLSKSTLKAKNIHFNAIFEAAISKYISYFIYCTNEYAFLWL